MYISTPSKTLQDIKVQHYSEISLHGPTSNRRQAMHIGFVTHLLDFYHSTQTKKTQYHCCLTSNTYIFCLYKPDYMFIDARDANSVILS